MEERMNVVYDHHGFPVSERTLKHQRLAPWIIALIVGVVIGLAAVPLFGRHDPSTQASAAASTER